MKTASEIKKILYGVILSDGSLDKNTMRFDFYSKHEEYARYIYDTLSQLTHADFRMKETYDKRFGVTGYRVWSLKSKYLEKVYHTFYPLRGRKALSPYIVSRLDAQSLAHVWMCDGFLSHAKNHHKQKVQNIGWFCLESFPKEELQLFCDHLLSKWGITSTILKVRWGFGYRIRVGGENLQKMISIMYPYILDCFTYKAVLFYKRKDTALELPSAEQYVCIYTTIEDIVRHPTKVGRT